jgi:hypothetical protein
MIKVQEDNYKECHRELTGMKGRTNLATGVGMLAIMWFASSYFNGKIIGVLPFEPWGLVSNMSHRGLTGDDTKECGLLFLYVLLQMAVRGCAGKLFGNESPRLPIEHQTPKWLQDMANPDKTD